MSQLSIIMYHYVRPLGDSEYPGIKGLELYKFRNQLDYIQKHYEVITSDELTSSASMGDSNLPENACFLTFDDGYKDHMDYVLPELLQRGMQGSFFPPVKCITDRIMLNVNKIHYILATCSDHEYLVKELESLCLEKGVTESDLVSYRRDFFLATRFDSADIAYFKRMLQHVLKEIVVEELLDVLFYKYVKRDPSELADSLYMTSSDVEKLLELGMYVGSHTYSHKWLNLLPKETQEHEIDLSLEFLKQVGAPTKDWIMCYPYGGYNSDTLNILMDRECRVGLTTKPGTANLSSENYLKLERFDTNDFPQ